MTLSTLIQQFQRRRRNELRKNNLKKITIFILLQVYYRNKRNPNQQRKLNPFYANFQKLVTAN